jgi:hypothetical protein
MLAVLGSKFRVLLNVNIPALLSSARDVQNRFRSQQKEIPDRTSLFQWSRECCVRSAVESHFGGPVTLHRGASGWQEVQLLLFLNLGTRRGWVVSITPRPRFTPGQRAPGTHCTGGCVGPSAGLDAEVRGKILCLCRGSNPGRPVRSQTLHWLCKWLKSSRRMRLKDKDYARWTWRDGEGNGLNP